MSARANVVLPAPRSPDSVTRSPGSSATATSAANRAVASSFGKVMVKLVPPVAVGNMTALVNGFASRLQPGAPTSPASMSAQPCIATTTQQIPQNRQYSKPPICHSHFPLLWRHTAQAATNRNTASSEAT